MTGDFLWVIWSEEHGAWWAPGEHGYVPSLAVAGRYTEEHARRIERRANAYATYGGAPFNEIAMPDPVAARLAELEP